MMPFEDINFQLVDLPPVSSQHFPAWLPGTLQPAAATLLVVDLGDPDCVEQVGELHRLLGAGRVTLTGSWEEHIPGDDDDLFAIVLPTLLVATKTDQLSNPDEELATFRELTGYPYPAVSGSVVDGQGLDLLGPFLFEHLGVVRVYTKIPGQPPDTTRPFTVRRGQTVGDVAVLVHSDRRRPALRPVVGPAHLTASRSAATMPSPTATSSSCTRDACCRGCLAGGADRGHGCAVPRRGGAGVSRDGLWGFRQPVPAGPCFAIRGVASASPDVSAAGVSVLAAGGNAVDAAVATVFAVAVAAQESCGIGGGGFLLHRGADGTAAVLDFRGRAGRAGGRLRGGPEAVPRDRAPGRRRSRHRRGHGCGDGTLWDEAALPALTTGDRSRRPGAPPVAVPDRGAEE